MTIKRNHQHLFPIIDQMVNRAISDCREDDEAITCAKGCDHCCHLLIEVSWEEGVELLEAIKAKPEDEAARLIARIQDNEAEARQFFLSSAGAEEFAEPVTGEYELADEIYDGYFYDKRRPCPFLTDGTCEVYSSRPTPCRLHLVASEPALCSKDVRDSDDYDIPDRIETLKEEAAPVIEALEIDGRWGQMGIMLGAILNEAGLVQQTTARQSGVADKEVRTTGIAPV